MGDYVQFSARRVQKQIAVAATRNARLYATQTAEVCAVVPSCQAALQTRIFITLTYKKKIHCFCISLTENANFYLFRNQLA